MARLPMQITTVEKVSVLDSATLTPSLVTVIQGS